MCFLGLHYALSGKRQRVTSYPAEEKHSHREWVEGTLKAKSQVNICSQEKGDALHTFAFIWECSFSWMNFVFNTLLPRGRFLLFVFSEVLSSGSEWWVHMNPPLNVFPQARKLSAPLKPDEVSICRRTEDPDLASPTCLYTSYPQMM